MTTLPVSFSPLIIPNDKLPVAHKTSAVQKTAQDFEAVFLSRMFSFMSEGVEADPVFGGGFAEDIYRSMLNEEYGKIVSKQGGIGIAEHVQKEMLKLQEVE